MFAFSPYSSVEAPRGADTASTSSRAQHHGGRRNAGAASGVSPQVSVLATLAVCFSYLLATVGVAQMPFVGDVLGSSSLPKVGLADASKQWQLAVQAAGAIFVWNVLGGGLLLAFQLQLWGGNV